MPKKDYREKHRKKTRYSSDSSDSERERIMRKYRERGKVRSKSSKDKSLKYRQDSSARSTSSSSSRRNSSRSSSTSSSSSSSSESSGSKRRNRNKSNKTVEIRKEATTSATVTKNFDLENLYKDKDTSKAIDEIESDSFKQATFQSQGGKSKILVDLEKDKILIPSSSTSATAALEDESLIHPDFLGDDQKRVDKWIKKLYLYRNQ